MPWLLGLLFRLPVAAIRLGAGGLALFIIAWLFSQMEADFLMNASAWSAVLLLIAAFGVGTRRRWLRNGMVALFVGFGLILPFVIAGFNLY